MVWNDDFLLQELSKLSSKTSFANFTEQNDLDYFEKPEGLQNL